AASLAIEWRSREVYFSLFVLPLSIPMVLLAMLRTNMLEGPEFGGPWFLLHIFGTIAGECFFFLAALASATYLYLVRNLKQKNRGRALFFFPPLSRLDSLITAFTGVGLGLFFLGLFTGGIWSMNRYGALALHHPKVQGALAIFLLVGGLLSARLSTGWAGPRWAWACLLSFCLSIILIFGIDGSLHWRP
ncbi:MAG TPA: cytochrome c biogenesis protein CcsA, partial [Candidatus Ozemobacteraceae bacterium]|nr:cytochrome c biogenesis protein CcsA [Candidatus Ozemobacteraceae bacterium]